MAPPSPIMHLSAETLADITSRPTFGGALFTSFALKPPMAEMRKTYQMEGLLRRPDSNPDATINFIDNTLRATWATTGALLPKDKADFGLRYMDAGNIKHKRKLLQVASCSGDLLLAYEMLRWGARTDVKDAYGDTPLATALQAQLLYHELTAQMAVKLGPQFVASTSSFMNRRPGAIAEIAKLLVKHHADVNIDTESGTPLFIACEVEDWELIELLLQHGADPERAFREKNPLARDQAKAARLARLISSTRSSERPPRLCPCSSGKPQSECHAPGKRFPYPSTFLCPCVSGKQYGQCCAAHVEWEEGWDDKEEWIAPVRKQKTTTRPPLDAAWAAILQSKLVVADAEGSDAGFRIILKTLLDEDRVDRAFAHVARELKKLPPAPSSPVPTTSADEWNDAVERYIAAKTDGRETRTLGMVAMVDPDGGTFFRRCALPTCGRVEEVRGKHQRCSGCKAMYYCNGKCQMLHWKTHKTVCKTKPPQMLLPSHQAILDAYQLLSAL
ncbi:hypothetical protein AURDEDRAFT_185421 [Auricularia subglabra TFB-10046 SS5]|nr:hypothetical protein AURDEDRAFT_185421 [Auricularia subglabra TFB-10046 SS5]